MTIEFLNVSFIEVLIKEEFLQRAVITGFLIGILAPTIGSFVVIRRLSFIADTLSHVSLAGISTGLYLISVLQVTFFTNPMYLGMIFSVVGALIIEKLRGYYKNYKEISMPIVMSLGTALSALFISLSGGVNSGFYNYLFGSILTVGNDYVWIIAITTFIILFLTIIFFNQIVTVSFDEGYAKLLGIKVNRIQFFFTIFLAITISLSLAIVGVLLVSSLMIIPVAAAIKVGKSFKNTLFIAILFSEISIIGGLWLSYILNFPAGATIVLLNILILIVVGLTKRLSRPKPLSENK